MGRTLATLKHDMRLQFRHGFYHVGAFVAVIFTAVLWRFPADLTGRLLPAFVFLAANVTTFYFIAGLVLFEKGQGTLEALVMTPLGVGEYLFSKTATLTLLATLEILFLVLVVFGVPERPFSFLAGLVSLCAVYTLLGFIIVARYDSINEYLMPSTLYTLVIQLPVLGYFDIWDTPLFYLFPTQAPLLFLTDAFFAISFAERAYAAIFSVLWIVPLAIFAKRAFDRFVIKRQGVS